VLRTSSAVRIFDPSCEAPTVITVQHVVYPTDLDKLPLYVESPRGATSSIDVVSRRTARLVAGSDVSFASYFNAFPLMHWAANTAVKTVTLEIELAGRGQVRLVRTDARGHATRLEAVRFDGEETVRLEVATAGAADGVDRRRDRPRALGRGRDRGGRHRDRGRDDLQQARLLRADAAGPGHGRRRAPGAGPGRRR
jgi:hypothetical protein